MTTKLAPAFGDGLRELGYVDGRTIVVEYRCVEGRTERGPQLAAALLQLKPDAASDPLVKVLIDATHTIPIVMASSGDPVGNRFVVGLARPGGNVTGISILAPEPGCRQWALRGSLMMMAPSWPTGRASRTCTGAPRPSSTGSSAAPNPPTFPSNSRRSSS